MKYLFRGEVCTLVETKSTGMCDTKVRIHLHHKDCYSVQSDDDGQWGAFWIERKPDHEVWVGSNELEPMPKAGSLSMFWVHRILAREPGGEMVEMEVVILPGGVLCEYERKGKMKARRTNCAALDRVLQNYTLAIERSVRQYHPESAAWLQTLVTLVPEQGEPATATLSHWLDQWRHHEDAVSELRHAAGRGRQGSWDTPVGLMFCRPATSDEKAAWAAS